MQQSVLEVPPPADVRLGDSRSPIVRDYLAMTKPGVNRMVVLTTLIGALLAFSPDVPLRERLSSAGLIVIALVGTYLLAAASAVFNMVLERRRDREMERTRDRPLASGRVSVAAAVGFGCLLTLVGSVLLAWFVNAPTLVLGLVTLATYLFVYTPLKGVTPWSTYLGAIPGALPPVMGWTAVAFGRVSLEATDWTAVATELSPTGSGVIAWGVVRDPVLLAAPSLLRHRLDSPGRLSARGARDAVGRGSDRASLRNGIGGQRGLALDRWAGSLLGRKQRADLRRGSSGGRFVLSRRIDSFCPGTGSSTG